MNFSINKFKNELKNELINHIIPFWNSLRDNEYGGFYGYMDSDLTLDKNADKGVILHSRILWFYSTAYLKLGKAEYLENAHHAYDFLKYHCVDYEKGGVYWLMSYDGKPVDTMKHTYCQAFFVYALSAYYDACKKKEALTLAMQIFSTIEEKAADKLSYMESFDRDWNVVENDALSENGLNAVRTMNTILHLIEAYTELFRVSNDKKVSDRLEFLLQFTLDKIYDKNGKKLLVFFDDDMNVMGDIHSYGHDIEATWLMDIACDILKNNELKEKVSNMNRNIVENIANIAFENGSLNNERENKKIDKSKIWWVQAEAVVGFANGYSRYEDNRYLQVSGDIWNFIKNYVIDKRNGGEWHSRLDENGVPDSSKPMVEAWKCPYHNGRMCLMLIDNSILVNK